MSLPQPVLVKLEEKPATEPAVAVGATMTTVAGLLSLVLYFFPDIPDNVIQGTLVVAAFLLPIVTAGLTRGKVWSPDSVQTVIDEAVNRALEAAGKKPNPIIMTEKEAQEFRRGTGI